MDDLFIADTIKQFLRTCMTPFTAQDMQKYLKKLKIKLSLDDITDVLVSADCVFSLVNERFLTHAAAFSNLWFSFKPTREEYKIKAFIPGHRFMPFFDIMSKPYNATLILNGSWVPKQPVSISMNTALDLYAFFGEGYSIPMILDDPACEKFSFSSVQYGLPTHVNLTGFSLEPYFEAGFEFGDRILCRIIDWDKGIIETKIKKEKHQSLKISFADMAQEEWYTRFEDKMLEKLEKHGPGPSIEAQLSLLFLEEQGLLCNEDCGSCEEFLQHTTKIGLSSYGIESRIWKYKEDVPYVGPWNKELLKVSPFPCITLLSTEYVLNSMIKDMIYKRLPCETGNDLFKELYPSCLNFSDFETEFIILHLKNRIDIVKSTFNRFIDFPVAQTRHSVLLLFKKIMNLVATVSDYGEELESFPQSELVILTQMADHCANFLEEIEFAPSQVENELEDMNTSLTGMADTFEGIKDTIMAAVRTQKKKRT